MLCAISCINNWRIFAMIFCFKHFNSNRCFDSLLGKFNSIIGNLGNFLKRKKGFILEFWLGSEHTSAESFIFRSIHPEVFRKIAFLKGFLKFLEKLPWRSTFQRNYGPKTGLLHGLPCKAAFFDVFLTPSLRIV